MEVRTYKTLFDLNKQMFYAGHNNGDLIFDETEGVEVENSYCPLNIMEELNKLNLILVEKVEHLA